jgi:hypothetical protein
MDSKLAPYSREEREEIMHLMLTYPEGQEALALAIFEWDEIKKRMSMKPCIYCGGTKAQIVKLKLGYAEITYQYTVKCDTCSATGPHIFFTNEMCENDREMLTIKRWNHRYEEDGELVEDSQDNE